MNEPITNHGTLINSTNYKALIKAQANTQVFKGKIRKVISVKCKTKVPTLKKVKSCQRHG